MQHVCNVLAVETLYRVAAPLVMPCASESSVTGHPTRSPIMSEVSDTITRSRRFGGVVGTQRPKLKARV